MTTSRSTATHTPAVAHRERRRLCGPSPMSDLPLALWPCAQRTIQSQRRGRFVPESNRHPAKMLPEIARRVITAYGAALDRSGSTVIVPGEIFVIVIPAILSLTRCAESARHSPRRST